MVAKIPLHLVSKPCMRLPESRIGWEENHTTNKYPLYLLILSLIFIINFLPLLHRWAKIQSSSYSNLYQSQRSQQHLWQTLELRNERKLLVSWPTNVGLLTKVSCNEKIASTAPPVNFSCCLAQSLLPQQLLSKVDCLHLS